MSEENRSRATEWYGREFGCLEGVDVPCRFAALTKHQTAEPCASCAINVGALTEYTDALTAERDALRESYDRDTYALRTQLGEVTAERDALRARVAELDRMLFAERGEYALLEDGVRQKIAELERK